MRFVVPHLDTNRTFQKLLSIIILGFSLALLTFGTGSKTNIALNTIEPEPSSYNPLALNNELYVPMITILKQGTVSMDCSTIQYEYFVTNASTNGEIFENVEVTDIDLGGLILGGFSGDDGDKLLEPNETWVFSQTYNIIFQDIVDGQVGENPASVVADVQGQMLQVNDVSHPTDIGADGVTIVDLTACQAAEIALRKSGSLFDLGGDNCPESIRYTFEVRNTGAFDLHEINLTDPLIAQGNVPGPASGSDAGNDGVLSPGETWIYDILYAVIPEAIIGGNVNNLATVSAKRHGFDTIVSDDSHPTDFALDEDTTVPVDETCDAEQAIIGLIKTSNFEDLDGDNCFETIRYEFTATNTGDVVLDNLVLHDPLFENPINPLPGTDDGNDGELALNETWSFEAFYTIALEDIANNFEIINQATIQAQPVGLDILVLDDSDPVSLTEDNPTITDLQAETICVPGIGLVKKNELVDLDNDGCNEHIRYAFTLKNTGTVSLNQVVLNDPMLGGDIEVLPSGDINNDEILSGQEEWTYEVLYPITQADINLGSVTNRAMVTAMDVDTNNILMDESDDQSYFEDGDTVVDVTGPNICAAESRIGLVKTTTGNLVDADNDGCPETIVYQFTIRNTGNITLNQILLTDDLLNGEIGGFDATTDDGNDDILSISEEWVYEVAYPITQVDIDAGFVTNQATVTAEELVSGVSVSDDSDDNSFEENDETITSTAGACVAQAGIGLIKSAPVSLNNWEDLDNDGCPENIPYTFTIRNTGAIPLEQVVLTDILLGPNPIEGPLPGSDINGDAILSPNETWTYQALYPITDQNIADTSVINQANVVAVEQGTTNSISDASDDNSFDENDGTITSVVGACAAEAQISILKSASLVDSDDNGCPETILYTFIVDNIGAIDLYQATISDNMLQDPINGPLNGTDVGNDNILSTTETWTFEATYTITELDFDEETVTNQAEVSALVVTSDNLVEAESNEVVISFVDICEEPIDPADPNFEIFNGITPNEDGINEFFEIRGIENYPDNLLQVFNRWGVLVFETEGYGLDNKLFVGQSEGRATIAKERALPTGTYYYTLTFKGNNPGQEVYSGYLYINRD